VSPQILTPADFAKLNELRTQAAEAEVKAGGGGAAKRRLELLKAAQKALKQNGGTGNEGGILTESEIIGVGKKAKADYEERLASIARGREGREKFGSAKGKKKQENPSSTTNKEKRKAKNFNMVANSREVKGKARASLMTKKKRLKGFMKSQKKNAAKAARL
jgi:protein SDA1